MNFLLELFYHHQWIVLFVSLGIVGLIFYYFLYEKA